MNTKNNIDITLKLGNNAIHLSDIHKMTVGDLGRYNINLKGAPVQVEERQGCYRLHWRGASRPRR